MRLATAFALIVSLLSASPAARAETTLDLPAAIEVLRLREFLHQEVHGAILPGTSDAEWIDRARAELAAAGDALDHPQLVVVIDRNPHVQQLRVVLAQPHDDWVMIGGSRVSTGQPNRPDHYITPRGVFHVTTDILGYRAEGTLNENGIRGLGAKGMRVWDFGWHVARKGWAEAPNKPDRIPIRLMLHATDPDRLEARLGRPASQGCVRVPSSMNRFLDLHGVLDAAYEQAAATELRFRALLLPNRDPSKLAGNTMIVIDSAEHGPVVATK